MEIAEFKSLTVLDSKVEKEKKSGEKQAIKLAYWCTCTCTGIDTSITDLNSLGSPRF